MSLPYLLKKIITTSWFLAFVPAILLMLFFPKLGSKYKLVVEPSMKNTGQFVYADLNSDGISEMVSAGKGDPFYYIVAQNIDGLFYDQWNLKDVLDPDISDFFIGNYDHDNSEEIYVFSHKKDSLFLNINEILEPSGTRMERVFITKIGFLNGEVASILKPVGFFDENEDGLDEMYFDINSTYQLGPRKIYCFDLVHKSITSSPLTGSIFLDPKMADSDGDQKIEIYGSMSASGNYSANIPYSDSSTWLMIFNDKLNFEFPPVEFPGFANGLDVLPYESDSLSGYVVSHWTSAADTTLVKSRIMIYTKEGKLFRYRLFSELGNIRSAHLFVNNHFRPNKIYILSDDFIELNDKLELVRKIKLPFKSKIYSYQADLNGDGEEEFLLYSEVEQKLSVYSSDLQRLTETEFTPAEPFWTFSKYFSRDKEYQLFLSSGENGYFLKLMKNDYYYLGYLVFPGIYLLLVFFVGAINRINTIKVQQKEKLKQRLLTLQLQGIKSQLDPHFTFNTLNSIASLIYLEDKETAYDYMNKFTHLLRAMLNDAERVYRSIDEELDFVKTYLDLEKLRFGDKFNYEIQIGNEISHKEQVPKLVLQTFAENAIKHGIMSRTDGGMIKIIIDKVGDNLKLTIEDNGIGRDRAAGLSTSTGKGLKLTGEFYDILNQLNKKPITHIIIDLYNESGTPTGTRVEVMVPIETEVR
jgi:two-component sensor histidine kinase